MVDVKGQKVNIEPIKIIPQGDYCYMPVCKEGNKLIIDVCPFWEMAHDHLEKNNGYCKFLNKGDWEFDGLLWDMVKECNINTEEE